MLSIYSIVFFCILGLIDFFLFKRHIKVSEKQNHKVVYYIECIAEIYILGAFAAIIAQIAKLSLLDIVLKLPSTDGKYVSSLIAIIIMSISIVIIVYMLTDLLRFSYNQKYQIKVIEKIKKIQLPLYAKYMIPVNRNEKIVFILMAISAGIFEEIIYRGFFINLFISTGFINNIWLAVLLSSILFSIGHIYQGIYGVIRTLIIGLIMGIIFVTTESILICILIHTLIDISSFIYYEKTRTA